MDINEIYHKRPGLMKVAGALGASFGFALSLAGLLFIISAIKSLPGLQEITHKMSNIGEGFTGGAMLLTGGTLIITIGGIAYKILFNKETRKEIEQEEEVIPEPTQSPYVKQVKHTLSVESSSERRAMMLQPLFNALAYDTKGSLELIEIVIGEIRLRGESEETATEILNKINYSEKVKAELVKLDQEID
jgi:hypothetical protein